MIDQTEQTPRSIWRQHQASPHEECDHNLVFGVESHLEVHNAISKHIKLQLVFNLQHIWLLGTNRLVIIFRSLKETNIPFRACSQQYDHLHPILSLFCA